MQAPDEIDSGLNKIQKPPSQARGWVVALVIIGLSALLCLVLWLNLSKKAPPENASEKKEEGRSDVVELGKGLSTVELVTVTRKPPVAMFSVTGTVEPNQQQLQQITPLVSGRVEDIYVSLGDYVKPGMLLVRIDSPQVAELHGKLHEAETRLRLARLSLNRVQQAANRVSVLKSKATLDEAEANLKRTKLLVAEGLTARKDMVAAQSEYDRAKAEYNFQKDISLNREVAEAKAELKTAETEAEHIRDGLKALDAHLPKESEGTEHDISRIELRSPIAGTVIERLVNPGSGFEQGKPLLTIANTATLWVIANVPEKQMAQMHVGMPARVLLERKTVVGKVSYIDPRLNEDTRTARVRIEINNPGQRIQVGSFAQIEFDQRPLSSAEIYVPEAAVQRVEGKPVVFVYAGGGKYAIRNVDVGLAASGLVPVYKGLEGGEKIAGNGSFVLKSKLLKEQFGDED